MGGWIPRGAPSRYGLGRLLAFRGWVEEVAFHCSRMLQRANQTLKVIVRRVSAFDLGWSRGFSDYNVARMPQPLVIAISCREIRFTSPGATGAKGCYRQEWVNARRLLITNPVQLGQSKQRSSKLAN